LLVDTLEGMMSPQLDFSELVCIMVVRGWVMMRFRLRIGGIIYHLWQVQDISYSIEVLNQVQRYKAKGVYKGEI